MRGERGEKTVGTNMRSAQGAGVSKNGRSMQREWRGNLPTKNSKWLSPPTDELTPSILSAWVVITATNRRRTASQETQQQWGGGAKGEGESGMIGEGVWDGIRGWGEGGGRAREREGTNSRTTHEGFLGPTHSQDEAYEAECTPLPAPRGSEAHQVACSHQCSVVPASHLTVVSCRFRTKRNSRAVMMIFVFQTCTRQAGRHHTCERDIAPALPPSPPPPSNPPMASLA